MKLRIKGNSLRLRLTRTEVKALMAQGRVEESIAFDAESKLTYAVEKSQSALSISCAYTPRTVTVLIPAGQVADWAEGEQVSLHSSQLTATGPLDLLVEKDFACLDRSHADNEDTFPNPHATGSC